MCFKNIIKIKVDRHITEKMGKERETKMGLNMPRNTFVKTGF